MKEEDIKKLNIFEKLSLITDEIGVIEKNLNVPVIKQLAKETFWTMSNQLKENTEFILIQLIEK